MKDIFNKIIALINKILFNRFSLTVYYTKTVEQPIADGKYDFVDNEINAENFPISPEMVGKKAEISAKLFYSIAEMDKDGYRPATLRELLAFIAAYPNQRRFRIIASGSVLRDDSSVPFVDTDTIGRGLYLGWFDGGWPARYRFLGVKK